MSAIARRSLLGGLAAAALAGRIGHAQAPATANELRFGALFPFSGTMALLGDESFRGLEMAVEERNAAEGLLGRPIRLVKADATDQAQATAEARRLLGPERALAIFGSYSSGLGFAASQAAELQGAPYFELSAIADPITERGFRNLFRTCPRASDFAAVALDAVAEVLAPLLAVPPAALRLGLLHEETLYGQSVSSAQQAQFAARGLRLVEKLACGGRAADMVAAARRLREAGAEVVLHAGLPNDIVHFYRAMGDIGWKPRMVVGASGGYSLVDTARAIGPAFEGTMNVDFTQFEVKERAAPGARQFLEAYRRKYGSEPRSGHSLANYVGARLCFDAIQRAGGTEPERIRAAMLATDLPEGATPTGWGAKFDETGQNQRARPLLMQWQGGKPVTIFPAEAAVATARPGLSG